MKVHLTRTLFEKFLHIYVSPTTGYFSELAAFYYKCILLVLISSGFAFSQMAVSGENFGYTQGQFSVSDAGAATYSIPLVSPPGTGNVQPQLSLQYNSLGGNGPLGLGWSLQGLSAITRIGRTRAQDDTISAATRVKSVALNVSYTKDDRYSLDGSRLVLAPESILADQQFDINYGNDQTVYYTEQQTFTKIILYANSATGAPQSFKAYTKSGLIIEYGNTDNARVVDPVKGIGIQWLVNRIEDRKGNYMTFTYLRDDQTGEYLPESILYTGNTPANLAPYNKILFTYESRTDLAALYGLRFQQKNTLSRRLKTIQALAQNTLVRQYNMDYQVNRYSQLISVTECDGSGNCFKPTKFQWQNDIGSPGNAVALSINPSKTTGDFNGDGLLDYVVYTKGSPILVNNEYQVTIKYDFYINDGNRNFNLTTSFSDVMSFFPSDYNDFANTTLLVVEQNGDNIDDLILQWPGKPIYIPSISWYVGISYVSILSNPSSNNAYGCNYKRGNPVGTGSSDAAGTVISAFTDITGDAVSDCFIFYYKSGKPILGNTLVYDKLPGTQTASAYSVLQNSTITGYNTGLNFTSPVTHTVDLNGDGLAEVLSYDKATGTNLILYAGSILKYTSIADRQNSFRVGYRSYVINTITPNLLASTDAKTLFFDANADKLADLIYYLPAQNLIRIFPSRGDGAFDTPFTINPISGAASVLPLYPNILQLDHDADGLMDLLFYETNTGGNLLFLNQGNFSFKIADNPTNKYPLAMFKSGNWYKIGAFLKGSVADVLYFDAAQNKSFIMPLGQKSSILINKITNGANLTTSIYYDNLLNQDFHKRTGNIQYPVIDFQAALSATSKVRVSSPDNYKTTKTYRYEGATLNIEGRGFRGFSKTIETDSITGIYSIKTFRQDIESWRYGSTPLQKLERFYKDGGLISIVENTATLIPYPTSIPSDKLHRAKSFFAYNSAKKSIDYVTGKTRDTRQHMDAFGNPVYVVTDYANGYRDSTQIAYRNDTGNWLLGLPTSTTLSYIGTNQATINRQSSAEYETLTGLVTRKTTYPNLNENQKQVVSYLYDSFGNIIQQDLTAWNGSQTETRSNFSTYESTGRFILTKTNALTQTTSATYDSKLGVKFTETDPNNLTTIYQYDDFGRLVKKIDPDATWQATSYRLADKAQFNSPDGAVHLIYHQTSQGKVRLEHFDAYGRSIESKSKGFDGRFVVVQRTYQHVGVTDHLKETYPYFEGETPGGYTINEHDILNRPSKRYETKPGGLRVATTKYAGQLIVNTNYAGQTKIEVRDSKDQLVECRWNDGHNIYYGYNTAGNQVASRDLKNNSLIHDYDERGIEKAMSDPDMGLYQYAYNGFGELISQTYPNGDIVRMEYDKLGRLVKRTEKEGITTWQYDTGNKAIGGLSNVTSYSTQTAYTYDNLGRRAQEFQTIAGITYTSIHTYDTQGRVQQLTYPTGLKLKYVYNANGYLAELKNGTTDASFWKQTASDASGHTIQQQFGNGVVTDQQYDPSTQYLLEIKSAKNSSVLQQFAYQYDDLANLTERRDVKRSKREAFTYDALNRLTSSQVDGAARINLEYDELGNITSKSDVGKYFYGPASSGPHQLTTITSSVSSLSCSYSLNIGTEYNSFNKISRMSNDTAYAQITYDDNHQRVIQKLFIGNSTIPVRTKQYVGKLMEVESFVDGRTQITHYLNGVGLWIDYKPKSGNTTSQIKYALKDHLGSNTGFTDASGALSDEFNFDAWGQRRNVDWTPLTNNYTGYERGYTDHEHYDLFSLIDMNGRVYDPVLCRFLSPDPVIQDQTNLQAFNRYSYVMNNPLNATDPSGYTSYGNNSNSSGQTWLQSSNPTWASSTNPTWNNLSPSTTAAIFYLSDSSPNPLEVGLGNNRPSSDNSSPTTYNVFTYPDWRKESINELIKSVDLSPADIALDEFNRAIPESFIRVDNDRIYNQRYVKNDDGWNRLQAFDDEINSFQNSWTSGINSASYLISNPKINKILDLGNKITSDFIVIPAKLSAAYTIYQQGFTYDAKSYVENILGKRVVDYIIGGVLLVLPGQIVDKIQNVSHDYIDKTTDYNRNNDKK